MARPMAEAMGTESIRAATGKTYEAWRDLLDAAGAPGWNHTATARWLVNDQGVDSWWAQAITVDYEQVRKGRLPGQKEDGTFSTQRSKTIRASRLEALEAVAAAVRGVHGDETGANLSASMPNVRWKLADGTRLHVAAGIEKDSGTPITITHERLASHDAMEPARADITALLEGVARNLT